MAANTNPIFTLTPNVGRAAPITGTTGQGGTGGTAPSSPSTLFTAGANGSKVEEICVIASATANLTMVNIFIYDGTTYWLYDQFNVTAQAVSTTAPQQRQVKIYPNLCLPTTYTLCATVTVTQPASSPIEVLALGGDF